MSRNSTHFISGRRPWITSNGQGIERPGLLRVPGGHTISRRSAAAGCANAPLLPSNTARRTVSTLTNASDQLSGSCRAIVRAECTAAVPLAQWKQQPSSRTSTRQQPSASAEDRPFECATRRHRRPRVLVYGTSIFLANGCFDPKIFSACGALLGASPRGRCRTAQNRLP